MYEQIKKKLDEWLKSHEKYNLNDFFNTSKMNELEIKRFLKNNDNYRFIRLFFIEIFNEMVFENLVSKNINDMTSKEKSFYRLLIKCICVYSLLNQKINYGGYFEIKNLTLNNFQKILESNQVKKDNSCFFYRGQTNFSWGLIPSMFRNYNFSSYTDGEIFDIKKMHEKYEESGLITKYNQTIATKLIRKFSDITYDYISYMQHSLSYSPLIDLTSKMEISIQFSLGNKPSVNDFFGINSAVFAFEVQNKQNIITVEEANNLIKNDFNVIILKDKIVPGTYMTVSDSNNNPYYLDFTTIDSIIEHLRPKYKIIEGFLNDRMRYQHGNFILFYDYVLVNNRILFTLNKDLNVIQYNILKMSKEPIYKKINKLFPYYNMDYLMNPYDYFNK